MACKSLAVENRLNEQISPIPRMEKTQRQEPEDGMTSVSREDAAISSLLQQLLQEKLVTNLQSNCTRPFSIFDCGFCNGLLLDPRTLSCGHSFCNNCLPPLEDRRVDCPSCGSQSKLPSSQKNLSLDLLMSKIFPSRNCWDRDLTFSVTETLAERNDFIDNCSQGLRSFHLVHGHALSLIEDGNVDSALWMVDNLNTCRREHKRSTKYYVRGQGLLAKKSYREAVVNFAFAYLMNPQKQSIKDHLMKAMTHYLDSVESRFLEKNAISSYIADAVSRLTESLKQEQQQDIKSGTCLDCDSLWKRFEDSGISLSNGLQCAVCTRLFLEPVSLPCGHSFCCECLERSLDFRSSCPLCRSNSMEVIGVKEKKPDSVLKAVIQELFPQEYLDRKQSLSNELEIFSRASSDEAEEIPIFVCSLTLPTIQCMFHIFEPRYRYMLRKSMQTGSHQFGMCVYDEQKGFANYGTMVEIQQWQLFDDGRSAISCIGGRRFKVLSRGFLDGFHTAKISWIKDVPISDTELPDISFLSQQLYKSSQDLFLSLPLYAQEHLKAALGPMPPFDQGSSCDGNGPAWMWWVMQFVVVDDVQRLRSLSMNSLRQRLWLLASCISHFI